MQLRQYRKPYNVTKTKNNFFREVGKNIFTNWPFPGAAEM